MKNFFLGLFVASFAGMARLYFADVAFMDRAQGEQSVENDRVMQYVDTDFPSIKEIKDLVKLQVFVPADMYITVETEESNFDSDGDSELAVFMTYREQEGSDIPRGGRLIIYDHDMSGIVIDQIRDGNNRLGIMNGIKTIDVNNDGISEIHLTKLNSFDGNTSSYIYMVDKTNRSVQNILIPNDCGVGSCTLIDNQFLEIVHKRDFSCTPVEIRVHQYNYEQNNYTSGVDDANYNTIQSQENYFHGTAHTFSPGRDYSDQLAKCTNGEPSFEDQAFKNDVIDQLRTV